MTPPYLRHNLYKETVVQTSLLLLKFLLETIKDFSVKIKRFYERLDLSILPPALLWRKVASKKALRKRFSFGNRQPGSKREIPDLKSISGFPGFPNLPGGGGSIVSLGQSRFPRFPTARHEFPCGLVVLKGPQLPQNLGDVASNGCGQNLHGLNDSLAINQEMTAKI
jgi:hypothetical protein